MAHGCASALALVALLTCSGVVCCCAGFSCAVHFVGELRSCSGFLPPYLTLSGRALSSLSCNWQVETPDDRHWRHIEGDTMGKTWLAQRTAVRRTHANHGMEAAQACKPELVLFT